MFFISLAPQFSLARDAFHFYNVPRHNENKNGLEEWQRRQGVRGTVENAEPCEYLEDLPTR